MGEILQSAEIERAVSIDQKALLRKLRELVKKRKFEWLEEWLAEAEKPGTKRKNPAGELRQDFKAATAALTIESSNRQTERRINRLKFLKRRMYGGAISTGLAPGLLYRR